MFQSVDRGQRGKISLASLQEVLSIVLKKNLLSDKHIWDKIVHELNNIKVSGHLTIFSYKYDII